METITQAAIQRSNPMIWAGIPRVKKNEITANSIIISVCLEAGITATDLKRKTRKREIVQPRQIAMHLIKKHTKCSLSQIGEIMGGFHHSTIIHSDNTVTDLMDSDPIYKDLVTKIESKI